MELRELKYFSEIARLKSMTKAAESLHVSQPALSKMIKGLESELGMILLNRSNKTLEITDAGMVVREYAQKVNALLEEMSQSLNDMSNLMQGTIHIGLPPFIGSLFFPQLLAEFHLKYANIKFNIKEYGAAKVVKSVEEGELELGVAVLPLKEEHKYNIFPLAEEEMKLLVHNKHRLSGKEKVHLAELEDEEFIFYNEDFALHDILWRQFSKIGYEPKILFTSSQWDLMTDMVAANLGVTILPESICNRVQNHKVKKISLEPVTPWKLAVITKKNKYISLASRAFIDYIFGYSQVDDA